MIIARDEETRPVELRKARRVKITLRQVIWSTLVVLVAAVGVCWLSLPPPPDELRRQQAAEAIATFLAGEGEDADIILLEEAIAPLGQQGIDILASTVETSHDQRLMQVFDGLDPDTTLPVMHRLRRHANPEIRHGSLLMLGRINALPKEEWETIVDDASEDRFIRQLAAHLLGLPERWWQELDPGAEPSASEGLGARRITYLRAETTFGDICDELAWVTGRPATCPEGVRLEPLRSTYYWQVTLQGMLGDLRLSEGYDLHRFGIDETGSVSVWRVYAEDR